MCNRTVQQMLAFKVSDWMSSTFLMAYGDATLDEACAPSLPR